MGGCVAGRYGAAGGWYGLKKCFDRARAENIPIFDAGYLRLISHAEAEHLFRGAGGVRIPLLAERLDNLHEASNVLVEKFGGRFMNVLEESGWDAIALAQPITRHFSSFRDTSLWRGQAVHFLKRVQIVSNDIIYALKREGKTLRRIDELTAFADYKLPQVLREMGILEYSTALLEKVDNEVAISHNSPEEIEIRAATIWAVELLRQEIKTLTAGDIDNLLWLLSQNMQEKARPYHKTRTIYY